MTLSEAIGSTGVALILAAFTLQQLGRLDPRGPAYLSGNAIGAGLACLASGLIGFWPFVVLEGAWVLVAVAGLVRWSARRRF